MRSNTYTHNRAAIKQTLSMIVKDWRTTHRRLGTGNVQIIGRVSAKSKSMFNWPHLCIANIFKITTRSYAGDHIWIKCNTWKEFNFYRPGDVVVIHGKVHLYSSGKEGISSLHIRIAWDDELALYDELEVPHVGRLLDDENILHQ